MNNFHILLVAITLHLTTGMIVGANRSEDEWILEGQVLSEADRGCFTGPERQDARQSCFNESGIDLDAKWQVQALPHLLFISIDPKILCKNKEAFIKAMRCITINDTDCLIDPFKPYYPTTPDKIQAAVEFQCKHVDDLDYQCMTKATGNTVGYRKCVNKVLNGSFVNFWVYKPEDMCIYWSLPAICYTEVVENCSCPEKIEVLMKYYFYPDNDNCTALEYVWPQTCNVPIPTRATTTTTTTTTTADVSPGTKTDSNAPLSSECQASVVAVVLMLTTLAQIL